MSEIWSVTKQVAVKSVERGFTHSGNLAYLSLLTLFPFFIVAAAVAGLFGRTGDGERALVAFLRTVPPDVADVLAGPVTDVIAARSGALLWIGALVGLWTTAGFIETIRSILRQAYGTSMSRPFWEYRLTSMGLIILSVVMVLVAFALQVILTAVEAFIVRVLPFAQDAADLVSLSRIAPAVALFVAMYFLFYSLTPGRYRRGCPKWPGALLTTLWWLGTTALLPVVLGTLANYDLTYGSLAGVMIALVFFQLIGLGVVIGAELNAALAQRSATGLEGAPDEDAKRAT
ncbi:MULTISPECIES: YihY/virulence factor BrkB family protein [unclassified Sphingomonas]|jgi:membrane protein|uniref:YihY/virulence factor BrkB family protein n=1 Tax=unclassified Sphingomonas TaxID=196159 RepID=UPI000835912E|nr:MULTISPECIES: YihY/virulence factor BrkB family protein [unclassified Sphingomonas]MCH4893491.1 YihY family inner membrane protein [Sphingomonas sp. SFZ2018-12]